MSTKQALSTTTVITNVIVNELLLLPWQNNHLHPSQSLDILPPGGNLGMLPPAAGQESCRGRRRIFGGGKVRVTTIVAIVVLIDNEILGIPTLLFLFPKGVANVRSGDSCRSWERWLWILSWPHTDRYSSSFSTSSDSSLKCDVFQRQNHKIIHYIYKISHSILSGILVYEGNQKIGLFFWPKIVRLDFQVCRESAQIEVNIDLFAEKEAHSDRGGGGWGGGRSGAYLHFQVASILTTSAPPSSHLGWFWWRRKRESVLLSHFIQSGGD